MKRFFLCILTAFLLSGAVFAQRPAVREEVRADHRLACGPDRVYDFNVAPGTPAPKGYRPVYISHYGRHGSRYAYSSKTYTLLEDALDRAERNGTLTEQGKSLKKRLDPFFDQVRYRVGDLTRKGWEQEKGIASVMLSSFPKAFPKGARVDACVSPSFRSALSMTSFCLQLGRMRPDLEIYEHQSTTDLPACRPNMGNPFAYKGKFPPCPSQESVPSYFRRSIDWKTIFGRFFTHPETAFEGVDPFYAADYVYMLVAGMESVDDGIAPDVSDIFTPEEFAVMWEVDNYYRFREYYEYLGTCCAVYEDMVAKADARLAAREGGADLRFGHDHVILTLLMIADIDGFGTFAGTPDEVSRNFQNFRSPMGSNLQLVFYRNRKDSVLVKALLNGEEVRFGDLTPVQGPYYAWDSFKDWLSARLDLFR